VQADIVEEEGKVAPGSDPNSILAAKKLARPFKEADTLYVTVTVSELLQNRVVAGQWVEGDVVGLRITVYDPETSQRAQRDIATTTASLVQVRGPCCGLRGCPPVLIARVLFCACGGCADCVAVHVAALSVRGTCGECATQSQRMPLVARRAPLD
jgi:hypothetical protein